MLLISYKYFEKIAVSKQNIEKNKKNRDKEKPNLSVC